jgi:hypothetical protein
VTIHEMGEDDEFLVIACDGGLRYSQKGY